MRCQNAYLKAHLHQPLRLRLLDGKSLRGVLLAFDTYTVHIQPATGPTMLVQKHAIAYITRAPVETPQADVKSFTPLDSAGAKGERKAQKGGK